MEPSERISEGFRSVIDDLTVQNKKLKQKLKKYEKLHCAHLQKEKLFEVRIHGLAAHQKRELEETLQRFASNIEESLKELQLGPEPIQVSAPALAFFNEPSPSPTSNSKPIDSAYASMSGQTGLSHPQDQFKHDKLLPTSSNPLLSHQNVKTYLQDIPETLMPQHSLVMSERSKSKMVVKRLEQIFTGRKALDGSYHQSQQQLQEVSKSAAQRDARRLKGHDYGYRPFREGVREARILPHNVNLKVDSLSEANLATQQARQSSEPEEYQLSKEGMREARVLLGDSELTMDSLSETIRSVQQSRRSTAEAEVIFRDKQPIRDVSLEQRPTRPLDLEIDRAQVQSDNIDYIRHLGIPALATEAVTRPDANSGWVYLNLLINMAQLHTLNVTPGFIRHAVADISSKLELSADGTKVRWSGGTKRTTMSTDGEDSDDIENRKSSDTRFPTLNGGLSGELQSIADMEDRQDSNSALLVPATESSGAPEIGAKLRPMILDELIRRDNFQYEPLFSHSAPSEEECSDQPTDSSSSDQMEDATALDSGSRGMIASEAKLRRHNKRDGPIIFYKKARFCTDLSGDPSGAVLRETAYCRYMKQPIGCPMVSSAEDSDNVNEDTTDGDSVLDMMEADIDSAQSIHSALDLEDMKLSISACVSPNAPMIPLEPSGLAGIQPEDNFVIKVQVRHGQQMRRKSGKLSPFSRLPSRVRRVLHDIPRKSITGPRYKIDTIRNQPAQAPIQSEIISTAMTQLPPSSLPPPSYICLPFSSSGSEDDEDDDEDDDEKAYVVSYTNPNFQQPLSSVGSLLDLRHADRFLGSSSEEGKKRSSYVSTGLDPDDDSSIDLLAHARVLDPDTIAACEREFDKDARTPLALSQAEGSVTTTGGVSREARNGSGPPTSPCRRKSEADSMRVDGEDESEQR